MKTIIESGAGNFIEHFATDIGNNLNSNGMKKKDSNGMKKHLR